MLFLLEGYNYLYFHLAMGCRGRMVVLSMQSMPITTHVVNSKTAHGEMYSI